MTGLLKRSLRASQWAGLLLAAGLPWAAASQTSPSLDRTVLPIAEPKRPVYKELDARKVKPPLRFEVKAPAGAPNVVIVLIDDLGFGVPSSFGGPIAMPTLDKLAQGGLRYNNFHTTALCSPTRAALKSGRNHHTVNMAFITELATAFPGATGQIPNAAAPLAETLRLNGYATAAFGKWHETAAWEASVAGPFDRWPTRQGFDKFYGFLGGETNQWAPYLYDGTAVVELPNDPNYHFMTDMTEKARAWIKHQKALTPDRPSFVYFAPGATHAPHHVPKEWIAKWKGKFDQGWDKIREQSLARQIAMGVVPPGTKLAPKPPEIKDWDKLSADQQRLFTRQAEVFAAYAEYTDHEIGRMLKAFEEVGEADNTLVFYVAGDNGTSGEGGENGMFNEYTYFNGVQEKVEDMLKKIDQWGGPETYPHMAAGWAVALDSPFGWMKQVPSDFGGTRNGMVVHWPKGIKAKNEIRTQFSHVIDVAPTVLQAIGLPEPKSVNGVKQIPMAGTSLVYSFEDAKAKERHTTQYFEVAGNRAIYHDGWFARTIHKAPWEPKPRRALQDNSAWQLYDVRSDFSLADDLATKNPKKLAEMQKLFLAEAAKYGVLPMDDRFFERLDAGGRRAPRPDGQAHLDDAGRGHDRDDGGRVRQREEPLEDHHGRDRGAGQRWQRHRHRTGRALRRLVAVRQGRRTGLRLQLPRPAAHVDRVGQEACTGQGRAALPVRLRRRRSGQGRPRNAVRQRRKGCRGPDPGALSPACSRPTRPPMSASTSARRWSRPSARKRGRASPAGFRRSRWKSSELSRTRRGWLAAGERHPR